MVACLFTQQELLGVKLKDVKTGLRIECAKTKEKDYKMKLSILRLGKKRTVGILCAISLFACGIAIGSQVQANAGSGATAVLPVAKGGIGTNKLAGVLGVGSALTADNATILKTARTINDISFNGSADIKLPRYGVYCSYVETEAAGYRTYCKSTSAIPKGVRIVFDGSYSCRTAGMSTVEINKSGGTAFSGVTLNAGMAFKDTNILNYHIDVTTSAALAINSTMFTLYGVSYDVAPRSLATVYSAGATKG
jgi:hypothetical protein